MGQIIAYIRVSTDKQDMRSQKLEILEWANGEKVSVDEFVEMEISSRRTPRDRRIQQLVEQLRRGDTLVVTELSRIGRSVGEVILLVNQLMENQVRLVALKQHLDIKQHDMMSKTMVTLFGLFAEIERDLISERTKRGMARARERGARIGRPAGPGPSKLDAFREDIAELYRAGVAHAAIARYLGQRGCPCHERTVTRFIRRNLDG